MDFFAEIFFFFYILPLCFLCVSGSILVLFHSRKRIGPLINCYSISRFLLYFWITTGGIAGIIWSFIHWPIQFSYPFYLYAFIIQFIAAPFGVIQVYFSLKFFGLVRRLQKNHPRKGCEYISRGPKITQSIIMVTNENTQFLESTNRDTVAKELFGSVGIPVGNKIQNELKALAEMPVEFCEQENHLEYSREAGNKKITMIDAMPVRIHRKPKA